jgi:hypothetical protein
VYYYSLKYCMFMTGLVILIVVDRVLSSHIKRDAFVRMLSGS